MEQEKSKSVRERFGHFAEGYVNFSEETLFGKLWKREGLLPRDRSLATVSVIIACGNFEQLPFHLQYALDNGMTKEELVEVITHICFYVGWPKADTALRIVNEMFYSKMNNF